MIGAADTSDNWNHLSIIIGERDVINQIHEKLKISSIHMRNLQKRDKDKVITKLDIKSDIFCICLVVNSGSIIDNLLEDMRRDTRQSLRKHIQEQYDHVLFDEINKLCKEFLVTHRTTIEEIGFEIDNDLRRFFRLKGLRPDNPSIAHEITDIIAYCNTKSKRLKNVKEMDISNPITVSLTRRLGL
ncbi:MAG: hypothetical protein ABJB76_01060 [Candidatus Nitrosocosmicus sp.]